MDLQIPPGFERAILDRVAAGRYPSTEDALKACYEAIWPFEAAAGVEPQAQWAEADEILAQLRSDRVTRVGRLDVPPTFELALLQRLESDRYSSPADVFDAFLTALQEQEEYEAENLEELRREVQRGIDSFERGDYSPVDEVFARLRARRTGSEGP